MRSSGGSRMRRGNPVLLAYLALTFAAAAWAGEATQDSAGEQEPAKSEPAAPAESAAKSEPAAQAESAAKSEPAVQPDFTQKGADTCIRCHDEAAVLSIFKTKHTVKGDPNTPFAQLQCESCHGPGGDHGKRLRADDPRPPIGMFATGSKATVAEQNDKCLSCHSDDSRVGWHGSVHERRDLACVSCHRIHAEHDPVTQNTDQPQVCYKCHGDVRADFEMFSAHPVRYAEMTCTSCHAPHDSLFPALLMKPTVNQTCESCHAQMRGPFLWEHPPVPEDCNNCHKSHGSVNPSLLKLRPPLLCQQCHSSAGHPSVAYTGQGLPGKTPASALLGSSCLNCHSHVHGSNAPSGADLSR